MIKSCEQCGKKYEINPNDIKGQSAKFKCRNCGSLVTVEKPGTVRESSSPAPADTGWDQPSESAGFISDDDFQSEPGWPEPADSDPGAWQEPFGTDEWPEADDPYADDDSEDEDTPYATQDADALSPDSPGRSPAPGSAKDMSAGRPQIRGLSLKLKITLVFVLLVFFSLAAVGLIASYQSHEALSMQAENHLIQIAGQKSEEYSQIFDRVKEELEGMALYAAKVLEREDVTADIGFGVLVYGSDGPAEGQELTDLEKQLHKEILQLQRIGTVLQSVVTKNPYLSLGYISTDNGLTLFHDLGVLEKIRTIKKFHPHKRPWYIQAEKERKTIWTDLYVDAASDELTVTCATPVFLKDGSYKGVIAFDVLLDTIRKDILTLDIGYNSYAFLVNKEGKVLVKPDIKKGNVQWDTAFSSENWLNTGNLGRDAIVREMIRMKKGIAEYGAEEGTNYVAYAPIETMNVSMGIVAFKKDVVKPATDMRNLIILVLVGVLVLAIIIGIILGNTITRPINRLTVMADLMSQGQMDLEVLAEDRKDELGVLTKSFNRLIISLKMALSRR